MTDKGYFCKVCNLNQAQSHAIGLDSAYGDRAFFKAPEYTRICPENRVASSQQGNGFLRTQPRLMRGNGENIADGSSCGGSSREELLRGWAVPRAATPYISATQYIQS